MSLRVHSTVLAAALKRPRNGIYRRPHRCSCCSRTALLTPVELHVRRLGRADCIQFALCWPCLRALEGMAVTESYAAQPSIWEDERVSCF